MHMCQIRNPNIFVNSIDSFRSISCSFLRLELLTSISLSQYPLSLASLRHILILIKKSFLLNASEERM